MKLFKSGKHNTFYYVTSVTHNRVPVFRSQRACEILIETFAEVRDRFPFKLVAYVIMPDHFHFIVNPKDCDISKLLLRVRGNSARKIIDWLQKEKKFLSLQKLRLKHKQKREHSYALWQKDPSVVDLYSHKFLVQKSGYIHHNPVRAGLTDHAAKWRWSSYHALLPHDPGEVAIEMDRPAYWTEDEIAEARGVVGQ